MRFYNQQHRHYCGIDLHARTMYVCVIDQKGKTLVHRNIPTEPASLLRWLKPYRKDLAIAVECMFCWYWLADLCAAQGIRFVLGHALYMKAIHGGKSKNDKIDSFKIAKLLRGGNLPEAYVYPSEMRATRDVMRRRLFYVRHRAGFLTHIQMTNTQNNLPGFEGRAKIHDASTYYLLRTVPGIGKILSLTILYEIHEISRFPTVGQFLSYGRLVAGQRESAGKIKGSGGRKMGNGYLKWAFSEAAVLFLRDNPQGKKIFQKLEKKHGKGKALTLISIKLARAVYFMLCRRTPFDANRFGRS